MVVTDSVPITQKKSPIWASQAFDSALTRRYRAPRRWTKLADYQDLRFGEVSMESKSLYRRPGRPALATQTEVDRVANDLARQGVRPSISRIRNEIGGSPSTIGPLLDTWWQRIAQRIELREDVFKRLPGTLAYHAESFFLQVLEEARLVAQKEQQAAADAMAKQQIETEHREYYLSLREKDFFAEIESRDRRINALESELRETRLSLHKANLTHQESMDVQIGPGSVKGRRGLKRR